VACQPVLRVMQNMFLNGGGVYHWFGKFKGFFDLSNKETDWIIAVDSYKSVNPTPETAVKHIQDVLDGKI